MSTKPTSKAAPPKIKNASEKVSKPVKKIDIRESRFVEFYLADPKLNSTNAAIKAGYSEKIARTVATRLLKKQVVVDLISKKQKERESRTEITQDMVLKRWWEIANLDVNELIEYRRGPCPNCWQLGSKNQMPNADCPRCKGEGHGHAYMHDTRHLKGAARAVYNGVKIGKDGLQVLTLDRDKALENVAKHLGMFIERKELTGKDGAPLLSGLGHFYGEVEEASE